MSHPYTCEFCSATFEHPDVEECPTVEGRCAHLMGAGWRPVWMRAVVDIPVARQRRRVGRPTRTDRHIFTRGGWICAACADRFLSTGRPRHRPKERRLARGNHQEGRTR